MLMKFSYIKKTLLSVCCLLLLFVFISIFSNFSSVSADASATAKLASMRKVLNERKSVRLIIPNPLFQPEDVAQSDSPAINDNIPDNPTETKNKRQTDSIRNRLWRRLGIDAATTSRFNSHVSITVKNSRDLRQVLNLYPQAIEDKLNIPAQQVNNNRNYNAVLNSRGNWNSSQGGAFGRQIAILDTGVQSDHPYLRDKVVAEGCFSSNYREYGIQSLCPNGQEWQIGKGTGQPCRIESCYHGTHIAGIAAGINSDVAPNGMGGVAKDAQIISIQIFSLINNPAICGQSQPCISAFDSDIIDAFTYLIWIRSNQINSASAERLSAVNLSIGTPFATSGTCDQDLIKTYVDKMRSMNTATIIAAGNSASFGTSIPSCISSAISVGSVDYDDQVSNFSNRSPLVKLYAPGENIESSIPGSAFSLASGSSMSAPQVAAAVSILSARFPENSVDDNLKILYDTAKTIGYNNGVENYSGKRLYLCNTYFNNNGVWSCNNNTKNISLD